VPASGLTRPPGPDHTAWPAADRNHFPPENTAQYGLRSSKPEFYTILNIVIECVCVRVRV